MQALKGIFLSTLILIILVFSSEIEFMPNHIHHPDKWHVFFVYLFCMGILICECIWAIVLMIKQRKWIMDLGLGIPLSMFGLQMMLSAHGYDEEIGFILSVSIALFFSIRLYIDKRKLKRQK